VTCTRRLYLRRSVERASAGVVEVLGPEPVPDADEDEEAERTWQPVPPDCVVDRLRCRHECSGEKRSRHRGAASLLLAAGHEQE
jgi:hypothetical protein